MHILEDPDLIKATLLLKEEKNEKEARLEPGRIRTRNLFLTRHLLYLCAKIDHDLCYGPLSEEFLFNNCFYRYLKTDATYFPLISFTNCSEHLRDEKQVSRNESF